MDITASEIKELRPWIKERLIKLQGFVDQDEFLFKAIIDSLENQRPRQKILGKRTYPLHISSFSFSTHLALFLLEQLKMFNLESSVRVLLENIEQQTKIIREKKKQMRMEKRKHTSISFDDDDDNDKDDERKKTKRETNLESLRAMETTTMAIASSGTTPTPSSTVVAGVTTSAKEERSKERDSREDRERSSRDKERSSRDKERSSRSSRDKERDKDRRDKEKSRHDKDKDRRDHHKEHRSSSSSSSKVKEDSIVEKSKSNGSQQPTTLPTINIPAISLPQPEDLQAKVHNKQL